MATAPKGLPQQKKKQTPEDRELLLKEAKQLLSCWLRIREFLLMAFQNDPITPEQEKTFLELKSETARSQRVVAQKIQEDLKFGSDKITDFLRQAISIAHLRSLPMNDKRLLVSVWHVGSVMLHRAVGALEFIAETNIEIKRSKGGPRGIKAIKSEAAGIAKKSKLPMIAGIIVIVAVIGGVVYFLMNM